jgi:hypothetical protein
MARWMSEDDVCNKVDFARRVSTGGPSVGSHIVAWIKKSRIVRVRHALLRATVAFTTLATGLLIGWIHQHFIKRQPAAQPRVIVPVFVPVPVPQTGTVTEQDEPNDLPYPEKIGIRPSDIEYFIDAHPQANLDRLWQRLKIKRSNEVAGFVGQCGYCKAQSFNYNLDDDADKEIVLRIADDAAESYRYLVFKERSYDDVKLLGHIDARGKYRPSTHAVILSGGKAWLVVEEQAANGSGLAAYMETVYRVSSNALELVVSYFSEVTESGWTLLPSKHFIGHLVSCEAEGGRARVTVSYDIEYADDNTRLFVKRQTAAMEGSFREGLTINASRSNITSHEFDSVYNYFSMDEDDFLTYNETELRAIAVGKDSEKKQWLKEFLDRCRNSAIRSELVRLLR